MKKAKLNFEEFVDNSQKSQIIEDSTELAEEFLKTAEKIEKLQEKQTAIESQLIERVRSEYEANGKKGSFCKTYNVKGATKKGVQITFSDKFKSLPSELKKTLSKAGKNVAQYFDTKRDIVLSKTDPETVSELLDILGADNFNKYFKVKVATITKKGFDKAQFNLPKEIRSMVKQYKPSVKKW